MAEWVTTQIKIVRDRVAPIHWAEFYLGYIGYLSGNTHLEYLIRVDADGEWSCFREKNHRWREVNGVCEEAEPVFKAALPKAQALAILKG